MVVCVLEVEGGRGRSTRGSSMLDDFEVPFQLQILIICWLLWSALIPDTSSCKAVVLGGRGAYYFAPQMFGNVHRPFRLSLPEVGCAGCAPGIQWVETKDAVNRTSHHAQVALQPRINQACFANGTEAEGLQTGEIK